ncbi:MAG: sigma 54-interacting transcriptional regulator [Kiritimatiellae bacterium]|nr:sigma 54-interacting transcriptional regulator [Kiritimatiellia bacterium]
MSYDSNMTPLERNEFFREVTLRICSSLDINEALKGTVAYLQNHIPMDHAGMYYFVEEELALYAVTDPLLADPEHTIDRNTLHDTPFIVFEPSEIEQLKKNVEEKIRHSETEIGNCFSDDNPHYQIVKKHFPHLQNHSYLHLFLTINEDEIGMLTIWAKGENRFTTHHAELLKSVKDPLAIALSNARRYQHMVRLKELLAEDNRAAYRDLERISGNQVIGADFGLRSVMELVYHVAPTSSPVLLLGATGTGKEVIANAIHMSSPRRNQPFIRVQCGAIPESLLDSELFGHEKVAFTGAVHTKRGRFERAEGGTIFLDEIAELTQEAQVKLLRVLQEKEFERLGGSKTMKADVRVIAATHQNLQQRVTEGRFREDLWFRLNVFPIHLPPLRERKQDINALVHFFIERKCREMNLPTPRLDAGVMDRLTAYAWPGNVRELQNIIERALILCQGGDLQIPPLGQSGAAAPAAESRPPRELLALNHVTAEHIRRVLEWTNGRIEGPGGAAELLQINHGTLRARMKKLGIPFGKKAEPFRRTSQP